MTETWTAAAANGETTRTLEQRLDEATWYIAELQFALKALVAQMVIQQVSATLQQQVADKLKTDGFVGL